MKQGYKKSVDARALLLDTAEMLFAEKGYFGVSVRDITDKAGLRNASINYHFETKEKLFLAVIDRRVEPLANARLNKLAAAKIDPAQTELSVSQIVEAFAGPMVDFAAHGGPGWKNYCIIVAHLAVQKLWIDNAVSKKYDGHAICFLDALRQTFPNTDDVQIHYCFQFMLSTTLYAVCDNKRIDTMSEGAIKSDDLASLREPLLNFLSSGILRVAGE